MSLTRGSHHSMGAEDGGNMFPGVTMPFGVVKIGVDLRPPLGMGDPYSGYHPSGEVTSFSMMHESGELLLLPPPPNLPARWTPNNPFPYFFPHRRHRRSTEIRRGGPDARDRKRREPPSRLGSAAGMRGYRGSWMIQFQPARRHHRGTHHQPSLGRHEALLPKRRTEEARPR